MTTTNSQIQADNLGNWARLRPVRVEAPCGTKLRTAHWVVTYENSVGGEISRRFKTKGDAKDFCLERLRANRAIQLL